MIRASASYTSGWGSFVLLKMDRVRVARGGSLSTLPPEPDGQQFGKPLEGEKQLQTMTTWWNR